MIAAAGHVFVERLNGCTSASQVSVFSARKTWIGVLSFGEPAFSRIS
jgi:hypothetical protein